MTQDELKSFLEYNNETGIFIWRVHRTGMATKGDVAGYKHVSGYIHIGLKGKDYKAHRLAWLYMYGKFPDCGMHTDHINRKLDDNRICNLRIISPSENARNRNTRIDNKSGVTGVQWHKRSKKWYVTVGNKYIGMFERKEDAIKARRESANDDNYINNNETYEKE